MTLRMQERTAARVRAADIIVGFGAPAVSRLAAFIDDERGFVQCNVGRAPRPHWRQPKRCRCSSHCSAAAIRR